MTVSMRLGIGGVDLIRSIGIWGLCGQRNWGEGGCGSGGNATSGRDIAALTVTMETEGWPRPWGNCLVDWSSVVDWVGNHWALSISRGTPTYNC